MLYVPDYIVRDRLKVRPSGIQEQREVGDKSVSKDEVRKNPEKYYPQWYNPARRPPLPAHMAPRRYDNLRARLRRVCPDLDVVWHPLREVWQVYKKNPEITTWWTKGWKRLFMIEPGPRLQGRILFKLWNMDPESYGNARLSPDHILYEKELADRKFQAELDHEYGQKMRDIYDYALIKNIGKGNKFSREVNESP